MLYNLPQQTSSSLETPFYTVDEIAVILRVKRSKAYEMVDAGEIPALRFGKLIRILKTDLADFIESRRLLGTQAGVQ